MHRMERKRQKKTQIIIGDIEARVIDAVLWINAICGTRRENKANY